MSASALLTEVEEAISACLKSQAYSIAERSQQRAQLSQLMDARASLLREVQEEGNSGSMATLGQFNRPT